MISLDNPDYKISLAKLSKPCVLLNLFQSLNIKNYCYAFLLDIPSHNKNIIMNIGQSSGGEIGDRIYRKVGNLPGWGVLTLNGAYGSDMKKVIDAVEKKYADIGVKVDKKDVTVHIWNVDNLDFDSFNEPAIDAEKCLINEYTNTFGSLPVGNFQDPRNRNRSVSKSRFYNIIEELT